MFFHSKEVRACIVTCGGLCPGINTVIREIVCGLSYMYGVEEILGIEVSSVYTVSSSVEFSCCERLLKVCCSLSFSC